MPTVAEFTAEILELVVKQLDLDSLETNRIVRAINKNHLYLKYKNRTLNPITSKVKRPSMVITYNVLKTLDKQIIDCACIIHSITIMDFCGNTRKGEFVDCRRHVMYYMRRELHYTYEKIGTIFRKDHSTVIHSCNQHENFMHSSKQYAKVYGRLKEEIMTTVVPHESLSIL
jgi:chromosomal replication initiation ATPase DnaA